MPFYHASLRTFDPDTLLTAPPAVIVYPQAVAAIESAKLVGHPTRTACYFACGSPGNAATYLNAQVAYNNVPIYVYECSFPAGYHSGAMALVKAIDTKLGSGQPVQRAIDEYWYPTLRWLFLETFGPELLIVRQVPAPSLPEMGAASGLYQIDLAKANAL